jgi:hypothetical protein
MSYDTPKRLPSIAHAVIVTHAYGDESDTPGLFVPPFPEIDLNNWDGFTLSHFPWVGIKAPYAHLSDDERIRRIELILHHELYHRDLAHTAFSLLRKHEMFKLYGIMLTTIEEGRESIEVPLRPDLLRNELEKQWEIVIHLKNVSSLIEEAFAIHSSLLDARRLRLISPTTRLKLISTARDIYGKEMPEFPVIYDHLDFIAGKIGRTATKFMIYNVMETLNPTVALLDIMSVMCDIYLPLRDPVNDFLWKLPTDETNYIRTLTDLQVNQYFGKVIELLDPDGSSYQRTRMSEIAADIKRLWSDINQGIREEDNVLKLKYSSDPTAFLFTQYAYFNGIFRHVFHEVGNSQEVEYGNTEILIEAIRQQICQGIGLLCPFWMYGLGCCSLDNKALLENVWTCTYRNTNCELWHRWGCLKQ